MERKKGSVVIRRFLQKSVNSWVAAFIVVPAIWFFGGIGVDFYQARASEKKMDAYISTSAKQAATIQSDVRKVTQEVLAGNLERIVTTDLEAFDKIGDIRKSRDNVLSLGRSRFAYFLSQQVISQHATVEVSFTPLSQAADFYVIVENAFQVIIGDGDRMAISLKSFSAKNPNWNVQRPKNIGPMSQDRYYLRKELPIGKKVKAIIDIDAKEEDNAHQSVSLAIKFLDEDGNVYDSLQYGEMTWDFDVDGGFNDKAKYGVGLIDPSWKHRPRVKFDYLTVTPKTQ